MAKKPTQLEANKIVGSVKEYTREIETFFEYDDIYFLGCSQPYVEEKINHLIFKLQNLKKYLRSVDKIQEKEMREAVNKIKYD